MELLTNGFGTIITMERFTNCQRTMPSAESGFVGLAIPKPVAEKIDAYLARDKTYRSRGEFVKAAALRMLEHEARGVA